MSNINVEFISSTYKIYSEDGCSIICTINSDKTITLLTNKSSNTFKFLSSKKEIVETISKLFLKAVELANSIEYK